MDDRSRALRVAAGLESLDERRTTGEALVDFQTAAAKKLTLAGKYTWNISFPKRLGNGTYDPTHPIIVPVALDATATASGARLVFDYGGELKRTLSAVIDGDKLLVPPLGVPSGPAFADCAGFEATLVDADGDGAADSASGVLTITSPGVKLEGVPWTLVRASMGP